MIKSSEELDQTSAICGTCLLQVAERYDDSVVEDADSTCSMCGEMNLASIEMLRVSGCDLCSRCVQFGLSRLYRA